MENDCWFAWNSVISHHSCSSDFINRCVFLGHDSLAGDREHVLEEESLVSRQKFLFVEGHALHESNIFTASLSFCDDEGSEFHSKTLLLLVSDHGAHSGNVFVSNNSVSFPWLLAKDLEDLHLEFGVGAANGNEAFLFRSFRLSWSGALLASLTLLLSARHSLVESKADLALV